MAVSLGDRFGEIIDPFCGHSDLGARLIRVLMAQKLGVLRAVHPDLELTEQAG